ncbi:unnamed protein product [Lactuca saligna]|uniref:Uncharacterized protein n=1 Tax=Lactuca saligna TaxID=75948 RepID=A0AA35YN37_LACSI|nr:unnamed protein product [Lactuca saligna]
MLSIFNKTSGDSAQSFGGRCAAVQNRKSLSKETLIRIATFNVALFSMALVVSELTEKTSSFDYGEDKQDYSSKVPSNCSVSYTNSRSKSMIDRPKSILKQSPLHSSSSMSSSETVSKQQKFAESKLIVSINLPDNEISLKRSRHLSFAIDETEEGPSSKNINSKCISRILKRKGVLRSQNSFYSKESENQRGKCYRSTKTFLEVLKELDADILALQDSSSNLGPLISCDLGFKIPISLPSILRWRNKRRKRWQNLKWMTDRLGERRTSIDQGLPPPLSLPPQADIALLNIDIDICSSFFIEPKILLPPKSNVFTLDVNEDY